MSANPLAISLAALGLALAPTGAGAQSVISRAISAEPVETTVTQTPAGTIVTRRPVQGRLAEPVQPAPAIVETAPESIDAITTREVVERADATRAMTTRQVSARQISTRQASARRAPARTVQRRVVHRTTTQTTRETPRLALNPNERHIVYQTIVEREVLPRQQVLVAPPPPVAAAPTYVQPPYPYAARPPVVAADEDADEVYAVGSVLPANVPLYAMPQNVALSVPAAQRYSYAYLGGRAYLVDPASGTVVADVTE